jgi:hypothetical protein
LFFLVLFSFGPGFFFLVSMLVHFMTNCHLHSTGRCSFPRRRQFNVWFWRSLPPPRADATCPILTAP